MGSGEFIGSRNFDGCIPWLEFLSFVKSDSLSYHYSPLKGCVGEICVASPLFCVREPGAMPIRKKKERFSKWKKWKASWDLATFKKYLETFLLIPDHLKIGRLGFKNMLTILISTSFFSDDLNQKLKYFIRQFYSIFDLRNVDRQEYGMVCKLILN